MTKTKIDWADVTWNPVWGCLNNCPYCYARKIARRFGDPDFRPTWKQKNFDKSFPKKPNRIFVNSMSDIAFWRDDWFDRVAEKMFAHPEHIFIFLTKRPGIYSYLEDMFPQNAWLGTTGTTNELPHIPISKNHINFISLEPLLEHVYIDEWRVIKYLNWVIIGAETGNRKGKVIPRQEWIAEIVDYCKTVHIPVFLKESLQEIWGEKLIQEFPSWGKL